MVMMRLCLHADQTPANYTPQRQPKIALTDHGLTPRYAPPYPYNIHTAYIINAKVVYQAACGTVAGGSQTPDH